MSDRLLKESDVIEAFKGREPLIHDVYTATAIIRCVPSAERPQGKWIKNYYGTVICSECKCPRRDSRIGHTKFCNACGARMEGADDE